MKINEIVTTPNGPGRVVSTYYLGHEAPEADPDGILIRHPKGLAIDVTKCALVTAEGKVSGWLCAYRKEQVTPHPITGRI